MKYKVEYKFGQGYREVKCGSSYDMEKVIEFMKKRWDLEPSKITALIKEEKCQDSVGDEKNE